MAIEAQIPLLVCLCRYCLLVPPGWPQVVRHAPRPGAVEVRGANEGQGGASCWKTALSFVQHGMSSAHMSQCICCMSSGPLLLRHVPLVNMNR